jgi:CRP-like cAMP-binding protein
VTGSSLSFSTMSLRSQLEALVQSPEGSQEAMRLHVGAGLRARRAQEIYSQGDPADTVYVLIEGEVTLTVGPSSDRGQRERNTLLLRAPAILGDRDVLTSKVYLEGARCLTPARVLAWEAHEFLDCWRTDAVFQAALSLDLAHRYARSIALRAMDALPLETRIPHLLGAAGLNRTDTATEYLELLFNTTAKSISRALSSPEDVPPQEKSELPTPFHSLSADLFVRKN